jgi:hypothetical protein
MSLAKAHAQPAWRLLVCDRVFAGRVVVAISLYGLFLSSEWVPLCRLVCHASSLTLSKMGHDVTEHDDGRTCFLGVAPKVYAIRRDCTYLELALWCLPFWWKRGETIPVNLLRSMAMGCFIFMINLVRLMMSLHFHSQGTSWETAHEWPNRLIFCPLLATVVLIAWWRDARFNQGERVSAANERAGTL